MVQVLEQAELAGKRVVVRVDFNVPMRDCRIACDRRIRVSLETLIAILERGGQPIVLAHLGRPKGKVDPTFSLAPVAEHLQSLLPQVTVRFAPDLQAASGLWADNTVVLVENLRFDPGEETNDEAFARALSSLGDVYVNDAFSVSHREHASVVGIPRFIPGFAGMQLARELSALAPLLTIDRTCSQPPRPFVLVSGGAKVSDKLDLLTQLVPRVDALLIGGAMAYTFLAARGDSVGASKYEPDQLETARRIEALAQACKTQLLVPVDHRSARDIHDAHGRVTATLDGDEAGFDIGPETETLFGSVLQGANTIVWNGPMGVFEFEPWAGGSRALALALAARARDGAQVVVGGGESAAVVQRLEVASALSHVSTGGGAFLAFLEGKSLPGIRVLEANYV